MVDLVRERMQRLERANEALKRDVMERRGPGGLLRGGHDFRVQLVAIRDDPVLTGLVLAALGYEVGPIDESEEHAIERAQRAVDRKCSELRAMFRETSADDTGLAHPLSIRRVRRDRELVERIYAAIGDADSGRTEGLFDSPG